VIILVWSMSENLSCCVSLRTTLAAHDDVVLVVELHRAGDGFSQCRSDPARRAAWPSRALH
jgi:hypothetical protein